MDRKGSGNKENGKRLIRGAAAVLMLALLAGCGKKEIHREGEDTHYPYTWQESKKGSILVTLDGSFTPEYQWSVENDRSEEESPVRITAEGKEKNGRITYRITPVTEGWANVTFVRSRFVEDDTVSQEETGPDTYEEVKDQDVADAADDTADTAEDSGDAEGAEAQSETTVVPGGVFISGVDDNGEEIEGELQIAGDGTETVHYAGTDFLDNWDKGYVSDDRPADMVSRITFNLSVESGARKGKYRTECIATEGIEYQGMLQGEEGGIAYRLWCDDQGRLRVRVPYNIGGWYAEELPDAKSAPSEETEVLPGIVYEEPDTDADGNIRLVSVEDRGYVGQENAFLITGYNAGTTKVSISSPLLERQVVLELTLDSNGRFTVDAVRVDGYTPDEEALEAARERERDATREGEE
ncbi:MAG: hypothetical protein IKS07_07645 [Lachnospiraceae bacterium]|nr:hypothetical protein [Lachnospiraceae bacterium]